MYLNLYYFARFVSAIFGDKIFKIQIHTHTLCFYVNQDFLFFFIHFLKKNSLSRIDQLIDIICVDFLGKNKRFSIRYEFVSLYFNQRVSVSTYLNDLQALPSIYPLFSNASWAERENWDMFGISFLNHPDLRRILSDYGFKGHPLRKDFPLTGYVELFYDDSLKKLIYRPIALAQEYRNFRFSNPWFNKSN